MSRRSLARLARIRQLEAINARHHEGRVRRALGVHEAIRMLQRYPLDQHELAAVQAHAADLAHRGQLTLEADP